MREYKFRGLRKEYGEPETWCYGALASTISTSGESYGIESFLSSLIIDFQYIDKIELFYHIVKSETVGQFIGIKDKNDVDIYEGDIIRTIDYDNNEESALCEIKYDNLSFCISEISGGYRWEPDTEIEIIGNIHENPELLKSKYYA